MVTLQTLTKVAKVDLAVLGDASKLASLRAAQAMKLAPFIKGYVGDSASDVQFTKSEVMEQLKEEGCGVAPATFSKYIADAVPVKERSGKNKGAVEHRATTKEPMFTVGNAQVVQLKAGERVMTAQQVLFFELLLHVTTPAQKEQVKQRLIDIEREKVLAEAEAKAVEAANDIEAMFPASSDAVQGDVENN